MVGNLIDIPEALNDDTGNKLTSERTPVWLTPLHISIATEQKKEFIVSEMEKEGNAEVPRQIWGKHSSACA